MENLASLETEFNELFTEVRQQICFITKTQNYADKLDKTNYIKERIKRCEIIVKSYKVELRYNNQQIDKNYEEKLSNFIKTINLLKDEINNTDNTDNTDDMLMKAYNIQEKDISILQNIIKIIDNIKTSTNLP